MRISDAKVEEATGSDWATWFAHLDKTGARTHKALVAELEASGVESGWWQQSIAVEYEKARGLRKEGETTYAGFQVGVRRTFPVTTGELWELLLGQEGLKAWLGADLRPEPGARWQSADAAGAVRTVAPGQRLRLTFQPAGRADPTTLQLTVSEAKTGATLTFHHEKLADTDEREAMRAHWKSALARLASLLA